MGTAPDAPWLVETRGLTKKFGKRIAVDNVDLHIPAGCAFGLLGPNGAGKTTLIRVLLGLTRSTAGSVRLMGHVVPDHRAEALAQVGAIVEEPRFHNYLTGRENLRVVAALISDAATERVPLVLERIGLGARADARVGTYSLGMRQRLAIARCLLSDPHFLILDEPTNGLDPGGIQEFRELIRSFVDEGRTVLLSSHLLGEIERTCGMIAILDRGKLLRQGSLSDLRQGHVHRIIVACDNNTAARALLSACADVTSIADAVDGTLVLTLKTSSAASDITRILVHGGLAVSRIEPTHVSLEETFFDITRRLQSSDSTAI